MNNEINQTTFENKRKLDNNNNHTSGNISSENESETKKFQEIDNYNISKDNLPHFKKILVTDDGKDLSYKAINYSVYLANTTGAELLILRILEDVDSLKDVDIEGSTTSNHNETTNTTKNTIDQNYYRSVKGDVIDKMEQKIKKCEEAGCKDRVSYKFLASKNAVDEIVNEIKNNDYDLVVIASVHIDSWFRSLFSETRKIISNISKPVLIIQ
jgi:nucleotide-binding universal stress UspA family protein